MNIYVGNIAYGTGEDDLRDLFTRYGEVQLVSSLTGTQVDPKDLHSLKWPMMKKLKKLLQLWIARISWVVILELMRLGLENPDM